MKTQLFALSALFCLPVLTVGCSDSNTGDYTYVTYDALGPLDGGMTLTPVPPFLGQQVDRVGRPGISRLLVNPFNLTPSSTLDGYNAVSDAKNGFPTFATDFATNLAAWDGINNPSDQTGNAGCGDQPMAATGPITASRYMALATTLANDYLTLDSTIRDCSKNYMALELGIPNYCGGRKPDLNAVDAFLNILQGGNLTTNSPPGKTLPLTTGVTSDPDGNPVANFPFLLPPS